MKGKAKLALGSVQFGLAYGISNVQGQTSAEEVKKILAAAKENGITTIDSAAAYGNAEEVLGKNDLNSFSIVSKYISPAKSGSIEKQFSKTLFDLGVASLYGYLSHRPEEIIDDVQQWNELNELQAKGLIQKIGFSLNSTEELEALLDKGFIPGLIQVPFNYFDRRFEKLMLQLKEIGCEIHSRSAFLQGLLLKDPGTLPDFFAKVKPLIAALQTLQSTLPAALLNFVLQKNFIDKVVIGVENVQQLKQNIAAAETTSAAALPEIDIEIPEEILMPSCWPKA
jgi:aryl-alcohol dehydrogenase-like predicted oxidoreductase